MEGQGATQYTHSTADNNKDRSKNMTNVYYLYVLDRDSSWLLWKLLQSIVLKIPATGAWSFVL